MSHRQAGDIGVSVGLGLLDEGHTAALIEPRGDATGEGAVARAGEDGDLAAARLRVVLFHRGLACSELLLDLGTLVAAHARELLVGVGELVAVELELGLGNVEIVGVGDRAVGLLERGGKSVNLGLVFFYEGLELRDLLLDGEGVSGQGAGLEGGLAQSEGEGLVDIVVGQPLGFAGKGLLFGGDGERREGLDRLPRTLIDEGVLSGCAFATEEWQMRHSIRESTRRPRDRAREGRRVSR